MKWHTALVVVVMLFSALLPAVPAQEKAKPFNITWKKTVVDKVFRSEGAAVVDVNKDGKPDIIVGDVWYEAPDWKMHPLRKEKFTNHNPGGYSEAFAVFADDFNGDGFADVIVIPFPGKACFWYENPKGKDELWKEHLLTTSACNETPIFVDLFKTGKNVLVMGYRGGKGGEVCYFQPGKDPTQPWERYSISGGGKDWPGSGQFYHGLGHGDVNGDGRVDVMTPNGWWEQPEKQDGEPWKWHPTTIGQACADMHVMDIDGDGKADIITTSAHGYGMWWHQQKPDGSFLTRDLFPTPPSLAKEPMGHKFNKEEQALYSALNKAREQQRRAPWRADLEMCRSARSMAEGTLSAIVGKNHTFGGKSVEEALKNLQESPTGKKMLAPGYLVGVGFAKGNYMLIVSDLADFSLPGQTHALHMVDLNGDGLKDLVTGRRWWAHGASGDVHPADPAYLCWFEAKKDKNGFITFVPHEIDDDSGIGTQFAIIDINGDGLLDIIISNKKGVFVFEQVRTVIAPPPANKEG